MALSIVRIHIRFTLPNIFAQIVASAIDSSMKMVSKWKSQEVIAINEYKLGST